jgi:predicted ATPase/tRNA A-37 threonylcarbamoyl transferase component Bud32
MPTSSSSLTDAPSQLRGGAFAERYRLEHPLGSGGMATVYLAEDVKHQRQVAVKVLKPELARAVGAERFLREITTTANLRHPHILPLFDSGEVDGVLFYVMPYVEGETLRSRLTRAGALPVDEALRIADEVADALHYAHTRGVVHRDIKPENILLENDHAIVADFGIAQALRGGGDKLTMMGLALGTPHYMSPEQGGGEEVDARSDLYALGCVTYEMLAGAPPYDAPTPVAVLVKHAVAPVPSLTTLRADLSDALVATIERAMAKQPAERHASLHEWRAALKPALSFGTSGETPRATAIDKAPPAFATSLLGRDAQLATAAALLRDGARVLSITGYGGTGKTRFAAALQRSAATAFPGGTAFVSLASVTDAREVLPTIAAVLDIAEAHGRGPLDAIATLVGDRRVLLLLDNFEQVVDAAEDIAALVARCPGLQVVATSRRPLRIGAEVELALPPLELPDKGASAAVLRDCPSVALFVQRAEKVKPGFTLSEANAAAIAGICRSLDGLPLALELAAARVRILEPAVLLQRLDHALDLLTSGDRDLPLRQRTLRATISWSYSLLTPEEQRLLRRLSVFHEGWTLDALEAVCYPEDERGRALDELASLVEKGLVRVTDGGERYGLLETIRAFAAEQLHAGGEVEALRDTHADHYLAFAQVVDAGIQGSTQCEAMQRARTENANLFAAIAWLVARARLDHAVALEKGLLLCGALGWYWHIVGLHLAGQEPVETLLAMATDRPPSRGRALARFTAGMVAASTGGLERAIEWWSAMAEDGMAIGDAAIVGFGRGGTGYALLGLGRAADAGPSLEEAVARSAASGNEFQSAMMMAILGLQRFVTGDLAAGREMVEQALRIQRRLGDNEGGGMALSFLAQMHFAAGDVPRAVTLLHESEVAFETVGDKPEIARVQGTLGYLALAADDHPEARRHFLRALRTNDEIGSPPGIGQMLYGLAAVESAAGRTERALTFAAAAQVLCERAGVVVEHPLAPGLAATIEALKASVPRETLAGFIEQGRGLTPAAVLAMVAA